MRPERLSTSYDRICALPCSGLTWLSRIFRAIISIATCETTVNTQQGAGVKAPCTVESCSAHTLLHRQRVPTAAHVACTLRLDATDTLESLWNLLGMSFESDWMLFQMECSCSDGSQLLPHKAIIQLPMSSCMSCLQMHA